MGIATTDLKLDRRPTLSPLTLATLPSILLIPLSSIHRIAQIEIA